MILIAALFLIIFEALFEGLKSRGKHILSEWIELFYLGVITTIVFMWMLGIRIFNPIQIPLIEALAGYVFVRFALFDFVWNIAAGQSLFYTGQTKSYDMLTGWFVKRWGSMWFVKLVFLIVGLSWLL